MLNPQCCGLQPLCPIFDLSLSAALQHPCLVINPHQVVPTLQVAALQQTLPGLISALHMSYIQDSAMHGSSSQPSEPQNAVPRITFLYKLAPGVADRSFGLNVARMAHLPPCVVDQAAVQALQMEQSITQRKRWEGSKSMLPCHA